MKKAPTDEYLEQAKQLNEEASERLLSRARTKLMRRLEDKKLTALEVMALQLEFEDEDLAEWRDRVAEIKSTEDKKKAKSK
jgi:hypothetical protein